MNKEKNNPGIMQRPPQIQDPDNFLTPTWLLKNGRTLNATSKRNLNKKSSASRLPIALVQHPGWLLIAEDRITAMRVPPWGSATIKGYMARISRNLNTLDKHPSLKINYDFSAVELEDLFEKYPQLGDRIREFIQMGQLGFVNGTYSQPHMQTLSLEANIRQLQVGLKVIENLTGYRVRTHAMQEPDYSDQTVQLLRAFGFKYATRGEFVTGLLTVTKPKDDSPPPFYSWQGLDGSQIPLAATFPLYAIDPIREDAITQPSKDGPLAIKYPDLEEFYPNPKVNYVLLDEALDKLYKKYPSRIKARIYIPWSYVEGTQAEELMRENVLAEISLIQAETLESLSKLWTAKPVNDLTALWKLWMKAQHHDSYWADGPELRNKSCKWCRKVRQEAGKLVQNRMTGLVEQPKIRNIKTNREGLLLVSIYPKENSKPVFLQWTGSVPDCFIAPEGKKYKVQACRKLEKNQNEILFIPKIQGIETIPLSMGSPSKTIKPSQVLLKDGWQYRNNFYTATLVRDGSFQQIELKEGPKLIHIPVGLGGQLSAMIKYKNLIDRFENHISKSTVEHGPVADIVEVTGKIGPVQINRKTFFYHELSWFETQIECEFPNIELGDFVEDSYKLCFWWPAWLRNSIEHGIPGGSISPDYPEICFYPVNWMDIRSFNGDGGIAIANWGTLKTFRRQGRIGLVLGWGTKENDFGNRTNAYWWAKKMDLRLKGKHLFRLAFFPHKGNWQDVNIPDWSMSLLRPSVHHKCFYMKQPDLLGKKFISMKSSSLIPTAVLPDKRGVRIRFYESKGIYPEAEFFLKDKKVPVQYLDITGHPLRKLKPWIIAEALLPFS
jgi:hypothetical protein